MNTETEITKRLTSFVISLSENKPVKKSWALMAIEEEEEEIQQLIQEKVLERRRLYTLGEYELEEGEILE